LEMSRKGLGMTGIADSQQRLLGIFTDGDLRRILDQRIDVHQTRIDQVMTPQPVTSQPDVLAAQGLKLMEDRKINGLFVVDEHGIAQGALNMHDLLKAGVLKWPLSIHGMALLVHSCLNAYNRFDSWYVMLMASFLMGVFILATMAKN